MDPSNGAIEAEADLRRQQPRIETAEEAVRVGGALLPLPSHEASPLLADDAGVAAGRVYNEWPGQKDFDGLPWFQRPSIFWMLPPFLIYALAFGGSIIPKLNLVMNLMCRKFYNDKSAHDPSLIFPPIDYGDDNGQCGVEEVQRMFAAFTIAAGLIGGLLAAITSPKMGALSDRYGRKSIIAVTTLGMLLAEILTIVAATYPDSFEPNWLLLGFGVDGLCGSLITGIAIAHSYAADCTPPDQRNVAFGYFQSCLFAGIGFGPLLFGLVAQATSSLLIIFYIALGCHLVFIFCLVVLVPESLSKRRQLEAREKYAQRERRGKTGLLQHIRLLFEPLQILHPTGPGSSPALRRNLFIIAALDTIGFGVAMGMANILVAYVKRAFQWDVPEQSYFVSAVNITRVVGLVTALPLINRIVRGPGASSKPQPQTGADVLDLWLIRFAFLMEILSCLGYSLAHNGSMFTVAGMVGAVGGVGSPTLQSALTKHVPADCTGALLGAMGLLHALARVLAPVIFSSIYYATVGKFDQAVFVCLASMFGVGAVISWFLRPHVYLHHESDSGDSSDEEEAAEVEHDD